MGISQVPPVPTPTAKGEIVVGTTTGPVKLPVSTTANQTLLTDSTTATGLKYGQTAKVWSVYSSGVSYNSITGNFSGGGVQYPTTQIYYYGGYYIFGCRGGTIAWSTDAKSWTWQTIFSNNANVTGIAYNGTTFVVTGTSNQCISGTPGGTWTPRTSTISGTNSINDIIWVGGSINLFIIAGSISTSSVSIATSPDGITWTGRLTSSYSCYMLSVNTANTVMIVTTDSSAAATSNITSTNGTTWTTPAAISAGTGQKYHTVYLPHVDKFYNRESGFRRSSSTVATNYWETAPYEFQGTYSYYLNQSSNSYSNTPSKSRPIWDSVNQRYYVVDVLASQNIPVMYTYSNADIVGTYSTGSYTQYGMALLASDPLPISNYNSGTGVPDQNNMPVIGYGNGIWVMAMKSPSASSAQSTPTIWSTAP